MLKTIKQSFQIKFEYEIIFTQDIFNKENKTLVNILKKEKKEKKNVIIFMDKNIHNCIPKIKDKIITYTELNKQYINLVCAPIMITGGEKTKNHYLLVKSLYKIIDHYKICRQSYIIVIGGGTLQDLIGFISSTAHRGIKIIRVPTTTLSQDDSGVGVKNGINFNNKKNFIGCFTPPYAVINDTTFLFSLKYENFIEGFSEAIKVALIKNKNLFILIKNNISKIIKKDKNIIEKIIYNCSKIHATHISKNGDPFENKSSRPLDFGHWAAHKIESLSKYKISHGNSVATGIALDCTYAYKLKLLNRSEWKDIIAVLIALNLPIFFKELNIIEQNNYVIFNGLNEFREHLGGKLTIPLIKKIGEKIETHHINKNIYIKSINVLKRINNYIKYDL